MVIFDSCVRISYMSQNDIHHPKAIEAFHAFVDEEILINNNIIGEVCGVLLRKLGDKSQIPIATFLKNISNNPSIQFSSAQTSDIINFYLQKQRNISFTDVSLIYHAKTLHIPLITFDKLLNEQYQQAV